MLRIRDVVPQISTRYFELSQMRSLLAQEWNVVRERAARLPSGAALSLAPSSVGNETGFRSHTEMVRLHLGEDGIQGDLRCQPRALPIDTDSIQLLVARHVFELLEPDSGIAEEIVRVLAPGGTLFVFGMNMLSPWRLWSAIHARGAISRPRIRTLARVRRMFTRAGLHPVRRDFLGSAWPGIASATGLGRGGRLDGAWVLVLAKQRSTLRAIPLRHRGQAISLGHGLVQMPSRRACL